MSRNFLGNLNIFFEFFSAINFGNFSAIFLPKIKFPVLFLHVCLKRRRRRKRNFKFPRSEKQNNEAKTKQKQKHPRKKSNLIQFFLGEKCFVWFKSLVHLVSCLFVYPIISNRIRVVFLNNDFFFWQISLEKNHFMFDFEIFYWWWKSNPLHFQYVN